MKLITPLSLSLTNFLPFTNEKITFPVSNGLKMLTGENHVDKLGANGAGKSALWEGFNFALYGTGIKGKKLSGLVSWEEKECSVVLELQINEDKHIIKRYGPPMRIELNGKPAEQKDIDTLIGISKDRFSHSILFGQGVKLFPDLPISERADLFDEILDLSVWAQCSAIASDKCSDIERKIAKLKIDLAYIEGNLNSLETDDYLESQIKLWEIDHERKLHQLEAEAYRWDDEQQGRIAELNIQAQAWRDDVINKADIIGQKISSLQNQRACVEGDLEKIQSNGDSSKIEELEKQREDIQTKLTDLGKTEVEAKFELQRASRDEQFWTKNACPECGRAITDQEKASTLDVIKKKKENFQRLIDVASRESKLAHDEFNVVDNNVIELVSVLSTETLRRKNLTERIVDYNNQMDQLKLEGMQLLDLYDKDKHPYKQQITSLKLQSNPYFNQKIQVKSEVNPHEERLIFVRKHRKQLQLGMDELKITQTDLDKQLMAATYWKSGFKRIRLFFVQQVLLALEVEIKASISALGLEGWKVSLMTESETKSGTTKLGIQIHVKSRTAEGQWEAWSGGESQRLRLAIAQGLGNLVQRGAGVWWTLEIWDEPTNWLSGEGIEDLLEALSYRAEQQKKQIWIVDHRALTYSGFKEIWSVIKEQDGSKIVKVSEAE